MADLDSLNIQISASSTKADKAIDELIGHLGKLNQALNNYSADSQYVKGLGNLTSGLTGMANAVANIDVTKIKDIASAFKTLAGSGSKMASLNVARTLSSMSAQAESASNKMRELAKSLAGEFGISDKKAISDIASEISSLSQAASDPVASQQSFENIQRIIESYMELGNVVDDTYEKVRKYVSDSSIYLSPQDVSEYGDDFRRMRGVIGINNSTTDRSKGVGLDTWLGDFQEQFRGVIPALENTQDIMAALVDYLEQGRDSANQYADAMLNSSEHIEYMNNALDRLADTLGVVRQEQTYSDFDLPFGDDFGQESATVEQNLSKVSQTIEEVKQEVAGNPFDGLVNGLNSLSGISITADQFSGLKTVAESLGKLGGTYAQNAAVSLPQIADGLRKMSSVDIPNVGEQLANLGAGISKLGSKAATRAQGLPQIAEGLRQLAALPAIPQLDGLDSLAASLSMFGRKTATQAVTVIPQLATAFRNLIDTLASAPNVSQNTIQLAYALSAVSANGASAGRMMNALTGHTNRYSSSARRASKSTKGLAGFFGKLYAKYWLIIRAIKALGSAIDYSSQLTEVENVVNTTFTSATDKVQEFADKSIMAYGMSELSAKQYASRFQAMGSAMGITADQVAKANEKIAQFVPINEYTKDYEQLGDSMADVSINLTKLTADMASFYNEDYGDVAEDLQSVFTGMTRPLRKYGLDLTQATLKEWALANGLDADITKMTQAEKTMLRYQYVMANMGHVMGDFKKTADTWANVTRTISEQFRKMGQLIGEALVNTFRPYLIAFRNFMNDLIGLTENALNALGKLLGWEIQLDKVGTTLDEDASDYADSLDDAADNAKKLKSQLRGIDELNNLTTNDSGSGDSDSGLGGLGAGLNNDYDTEPIIKTYESQIESFFDFGRRIAEKITEALKGIGWDSIYEKVREFGTNLADFLNGLITPEGFGALGETIASAIMTAVYEAKAFGERFNWENLGLSIASFVNGAFETFNFGDLADTIDTWVQGLWTSLKTALFGDENGEGGLNYDELKKGITEFFGRLDKETIEIIIGAIILKKVGKWVVGGGITKALGTAISTKIKANGGLGGTANAIGEWLGGTKLVGGFKTALTGAGGLKNFLTLDMGALVGEGAVSAGMMIGTSIVSGIVAAVGGFELGKKIGEWLNPEDAEYYENFSWFGEGGFFDTFVSSIEDGTISGAFELMGEDIYNFFVEWGEAQDYMKEKWFPWLTELQEGFNSFTTDISDDFEQTVKDAKEEFGKFEEGFQEIGENIAKWWDTKAVPWWNNSVIGQIVDIFSADTWKEDVEGAFDEMWKDVEGLWTKYVEPWWNNSVIGQLVNIFSSPTWKSDVKGAFSEMWDDVEGLWTTWVEPWWNNSVIGQLVNIFTAPTWKEDVKGAFRLMWEDIQAIFDNPWSLKLPRLYWDDKDGFETSGLIKKALEALSLPTTLPKLKVEWYAQGGFPSAGSLFVAGEAGAELVGSIGGRTAVASNGEITGITDAIRATSAEELELLRQQNQLLSGILQKEFAISKRELFNSVKTSANEYMKMTGNPAF